MRKKHFEAIAQALKFARDSWPAALMSEVIVRDRAWRDTVEQVALALETTNPHFDKERFLKAAGA